MTEDSAGWQFSCALNLASCRLKAETLARQLYLRNLCQFGKFDRMDDELQLKNCPSSSDAEQVVQKPPVKSTDALLGGRGSDNGRSSRRQNGSDSAVAVSDEEEGVEHKGACSSPPTPNEPDDDTRTLEEWEMEASSSFLYSTGVALFSRLQSVLHDSQGLPCFAGPDQRNYSDGDTSSDSGNISESGDAAEADKPDVSFMSAPALTVAKHGLLPPRSTAEDQRTFVTCALAEEVVEPCLKCRNGKLCEHMIQESVRRLSSDATPKGATAFTSSPPSEVVMQRNGVVGTHKSVAALKEGRRFSDKIFHGKEPVQYSKLEETVASTSGTAFNLEKLVPLTDATAVVQDVFDFPTGVPGRKDSGFLSNDSKGPSTPVSVPETLSELLNVGEDQIAKTVTSSEADSNTVLSSDDSERVELETFWSHLNMSYPQKSPPDVPEFAEVGSSKMEINFKDQMTSEVADIFDIKEMVRSPESVEDILLPVAPLAEVDYGKRRECVSPIKEMVRKIEYEEGLSFIKAKVSLEEEEDEFDVTDLIEYAPKAVDTTEDKPVVEFSQDVQNRIGKSVLMKDMRTAVLEYSESCDSPDVKKSEGSADITEHIKVGECIIDTIDRMIAVEATHFEELIGNEDLENRFRDVSVSDSTKAPVEDTGRPLTEASQVEAMLKELKRLKDEPSSEKMEASSEAQSSNLTPSLTSEGSRQRRFRREKFSEKKRRDDDKRKSGGEVAWMTGKDQDENDGDSIPIIKPKRTVKDPFRKNLAKSEPYPSTSKTYVVNRFKVSSAEDISMPSTSTAPPIFVDSGPRVEIVTDEDESAPDRVPLIRSTSLRTGKTPPGTPYKKKIVRFADAMGLDLAAVRHIVSDDIPSIPSSAYKNLKIKPEDTYDPSPTVTRTIHSGSLVPLFEQPGSSSDFWTRLCAQTVCLESAVTTGSAVHAVIRVFNIAFEKLVILRYTVDDWRTFYDIRASYIPTSSDGISDRFSADFYVPNPGIGGKVQFCIKYSVNNRDYWDNNYGLNYVLQYEDPVKDVEITPLMRHFS